MFDHLNPENTSWAVSKKQHTYCIIGFFSIHIVRLEYWADWLLRFSVQTPMTLKTCTVVLLCLAATLFHQRKPTTSRPHGGGTSPGRNNMKLQAGPDPIET